MKKIFHPDSGVMDFFQKSGQLILINFLWIVCCIPIVTIGASTMAMYHTVVMTVKENRSYPYREFADSFKKGFKDSTISSFVLGSCYFLLFLNTRIIGEEATGIELSLLAVYKILCVLLFGISIYIFPVISRYRIGALKEIGLAFTLAIRHLPYTLLIGGILYLAGILQTGILPWPLIFLLPAAVVYGISFFMEKILDTCLKKSKS